MAKQKIVLIGAGSLTFGLGTVGSIFESEALSGATISLHDINEETLEVVTQTCKNILEEKDLDFAIESTTDRKEALKKATLIINS
jgi:alpha-galactosidase